MVERKPKPSKSPARRAADLAAQIRIVVADHHAIDRGGMVGLLEHEREFVVVGEAATVDEALVQCRSLEPDVLVLTLNLPGQPETGIVPHLLTAIPSLRIVALSDRGTANCLVLNPPSRRRSTSRPVAYCAVGTDCLALAAAQGARATVRRNADPEELFRGIRAVAAGESWYDPRTTAAVQSGAGTSTPGLGRSRDTLSDRELDVAALIAEGLSNKEISTALSISEPTVKKHVGHILTKLGLQDRLQAGLHIARHPLIVARLGAESGSNGKKPTRS
jgi:two-component system response regulator DevR